MKKDIETIYKNQKEMKNTISEMKNTLEGIKSRLDEAGGRISELKDKVDQNMLLVQQKNLKKNKDSFRELLTSNLTVFTSLGFQKEKKRSKG